MDHFKVLGLMSGTSLDGLDMALVDFTTDGNNWKFDLIASKTISYDAEFSKILTNSVGMNAEDLLKLDVEVGKYFGACAKDFIKKVEIKPDFIGSHGHTVFHNPKEGYTLQIGNGNYLANASGVPVVNDFRSKDVSLGGQGAPLVPAGDKLLFPEYSACINLGGFSNISLDRGGDRIAWDMGPVNTVLNILSKRLAKSYDKDGELGKSGTPNQRIVEKLNVLSYYQKRHPKSLGFEWVRDEFIPCLDSYQENDLNKLSSVYHHISTIITKELKDFSVEGKVLITGGGALNSYLIGLIEEKAPMNCEIIVPDKDLINFKEAIIFGFLAVLRWQNKLNCLASVTGASKDSSGGTLYLP